MNGVLVAVLLLSLQTTGGQDVELGVETEVAVGRRRGKAVQVALAWVGEDAQLEVEAALFFMWMARSARKAGIELKVRSGFRTRKKQRWLWRCFETCSCNGCRRAARPGYSSHETGRAVDLDVRDPAVQRWLDDHAAAFGFMRTVRGEPWHFEYFER